MPFVNVSVVRIVQIGGCPTGRPLLFRPPVFLPNVRPATICQLCENRLFAVNSTPL